MVLNIAAATVIATVADWEVAQTRDVEGAYYYIAFADAEKHILLNVIAY